MELALTGLNNRAIAERIGTTEQVIKNYMKVVYDKLGLDSRYELFFWFYRKPVNDYRVSIGLPVLGAETAGVHLVTAGEQRMAGL
jgi:Bacterial regulatory proteins, luxR family